MIGDLQEEQTHLLLLLPVLADDCEQAHSVRRVTVVDDEGVPERVKGYDHVVILINAIGRLRNSIIDIRPQANSVQTATAADLPFLCCT